MIGKHLIDTICREDGKDLWLKWFEYMWNQQKLYKTLSKKNKSMEV